MTESEAKTILEAYMECDRRKNDVAYEKQCHKDCDNCKLCYTQGTIGEHRESMNMAIKALEKQIPKKPIEKVMPYSEEVGFNSEWHCPCCESYIGYFAEGMSEPEQMEYCNNCGQHIEKDWSDTD